MSQQSNDRKNPTKKPKAPASGYNIFFREEHARIKKEHPVKRRGGTVSKSTRTGDDQKKSINLVAARWKALTDAEKMVYQTKAKQDRVRYARELTLWQKQQDDIQRAEELQVAMGKLEQGNDTNPYCSSPRTSFREGQSVEPLKQKSIDPGLYVGTLQSNALEDYHRGILSPESQHGHNPHESFPFSKLNPHEFSGCSYFGGDPLQDPIRIEYLAKSLGTDGVNLVIHAFSS